jgi:hypothetical protein
VIHAFATVQIVALMSRGHPQNPRPALRIGLTPLADAH